jgi:hypothetical protein
MCGMRRHRRPPQSPPSPATSAGLAGISAGRDSDDDAEDGDFQASGSSSEGESSSDDEEEGGAQLVDEEVCLCDVGVGWCVCVCGGGGMPGGMEVKLEGAKVKLRLLLAFVALTLAPPNTPTHHPASPPGCQGHQEGQDVGGQA